MITHVMEEAQYELNISWDLTITHELGVSDCVLTPQEKSSNLPRLWILVYETRKSNYLCTIRTNFCAALTLME